MRSIGLKLYYSVCTGPDNHENTEGQATGSIKRAGQDDPSKGRFRPL